MAMKSNATSKPQKNTVAAVEEHLADTYGSDFELMDVSLTFEKGGLLVLTIDDDEPLEFPNLIALQEYLKEEYPIGSSEEDESDDEPESDTEDDGTTESDEPDDEVEDDSEGDDYTAWFEAFVIQANEIELDVDGIDEDELIAAWEKKVTPKKAAASFAKGKAAARGSSKKPSKGKAASKKAPKLSDKEIAAREAERARRAEEKKQAEEAEKRRLETVNNLTAQATDQIAKIVDAVTKQSRGEIAVNEARLRKGEIFYAIKQLGQQLKNNGDNSLATGAKVNKFINDTVGTEFAKVGMPQTPIIRKEISTMTQAYETYCKDFGGVDGAKFKLLFFRDQLQKQVVRYDESNADTKPVGVIELDKLLIVKAYHTPSNRNLLLSFLANYPRKTIISVSKLFDAEKDNVEDVINEIINATKFEDDDQEVGYDPDDIEEFVAERLGTKPVKSTKNISVGIKIWNDLFAPIMNLATQVVNHYEKPTFLDEKSGVIKTDIIVGGILEYFNPNAGKAAGVLEVLVTAGVITQDESALFLTALESGELNKAKEEEKPE